MNKLTSKSRGTASKNKQASVEGKGLKHNPKSAQANSSPETLEEFSADKGKQIIMSPEKSEESSGKNDSDDMFVVSPEVKHKGVRKGKQTNIEHKEIKGKNNKMSKPRVGRKAKCEGFEEVMQKSPSANNIELIKTGDSVPTSPEFGKNINKAPVVKRKTKAKTGKK